jgi:hypothetical protein
MADTAQGQRHVKDRLGDLFDTATADAVTADQVGEGGGQTGAEAVPAEVGGDGGVRDGLAGGAGTGVPLVLGDVGRQLGQLGDLMPRRLGVVGSGLLGQVVSAASAATGYEGDNLLKALGR